MRGNYTNNVCMRQVHVSGVSQILLGFTNWISFTSKSHTILIPTSLFIPTCTLVNDFAYDNIFDILTEEDVKEKVRSAMKLWMAHTCIKFVPVESEDIDYIEFVEMHG